MQMLFPSFIQFKGNYKRNFKQAQFVERTKKLVLTFPDLSTAETTRTFWGELVLDLPPDLSCIGLPNPAADKLI